MSGKYIADDNKLAPAQLAAMQRIDDSVRAGLVSKEQAEPMEKLVRAGKVSGALKRLSEARRLRKPAR